MCSVSHCVARSHSSSACVLSRALVGNPSAPTECLTKQFPLIYTICQFLPMVEFNCLIKPLKAYPAPQASVDSSAHLPAHPPPMRKATRHDTPTIPPRPPGLQRLSLDALRSHTEVLGSVYRTKTWWVDEPRGQSAALQLGYAASPTLPPWPTVCHIPARPRAEPCKCQDIMDNKSHQKIVTLLGTQSSLCTLPPGPVIMRHSRHVNIHCPLPVQAKIYVIEVVGEGTIQIHPGKL